jgi:hypothetical protein
MIEARGELAGVNLAFAIAGPIFGALVIGLCIYSHKRWKGRQQTTEAYDLEINGQPL